MRWDKRQQLQKLQERPRRQLARKNQKRQLLGLEPIEPPTLTQIDPYLDVQHSAILMEAELYTRTVGSWVRVVERWVQDGLDVVEETLKWRDILCGDFKSIYPVLFGVDQKRRREIFIKARQVGGRYSITRYLNFLRLLQVLKSFGYEIPYNMLIGEPTESVPQHMLDDIEEVLFE